MSENRYTRFLGLLPTQPLQIGSVVGEAGGVLTLELPGGGQAQARGAAGMGDRVFFRDGVVEGQAPALSTVVIEV